MNWPASSPLLDDERSHGQRASSTGCVLRTRRAGEAPRQVGKWSDGERDSDPTRRVNMKLQRKCCLRYTRCTQGTAVYFSLYFPYASNAWLAYRALGWSDARRAPWDNARPHHSARSSARLDITAGLGPRRSTLRRHAPANVLLITRCDSVLGILRAH